MTANEIINKLKTMAQPENAAGMAQFGIGGQNILGISVVDIRKLAKDIGKDHDLALELWDSGIHEARILASVIDIPAEVTETQMEKWVSQIDSWDICDQVMGNLFCETPFALAKITEWSTRKPEFEKRSAFSLLAYVAIHRKADVSDANMLMYFPLIAAAATDERNFVKKAVNWSLRQIGKRSDELRPHALKLAKHLMLSPNKTAHWIGKDAAK